MTKRAVRKKDVRINGMRRIKRQRRDENKVETERLIVRRLI
jgi:hypothetical protein